MPRSLLADFVSSIAGAVASITVAAPLDVVKTRIQNANFGSNVGGATIIADMVRKEGMSSFFKGLTPKILVVGPKLVFSYTLAQSLIPFFGKFGESGRGLATYRHGTNVGRLQSNDLRSTATCGLHICGRVLGASLLGVQRETP